MLGNEDWRCCYELIGLKLSSFYLYLVVIAAARTSLTFIWVECHITKAMLVKTQLIAPVKGVLSFCSTFLYYSVLYSTLRSIRTNVNLCFNMVWVWLRHWRYDYSTIWWALQPLRFIVPFSRFIGSKGNLW